MRSTRRIDEEYRKKYAEVPWQSIAGMRNVLVHDYFGVDFEVVWKVVERDLPLLEDVMRKLLGEL